MTRVQVLNLIATGVVRQNALAKVLFPDKRRADIQLSDKLLNKRGKYLTQSDIQKINDFFQQYLK